MHKFAGYLIKNADGNVVQYAPTRIVATQSCQQHGFPLTAIVQIYEWVALPYVEPAVEQLEDGEWSEP